MHITISTLISVIKYFINCLKLKIFAIEILLYFSFSFYKEQDFKWYIIVEDAYKSIMNQFLLFCIVY